jgi:hypothetical protein
MKGFRFFGVLVAVLIVIALWLGSLVLMPHIAAYLNNEAAVCGKAVDGHVQCSSIQDLGSVGDIFGAINALFSGLALGAIALTLWVESRSRRESRKPLVLGSLEGAGGVEAFRPEPRGAEAMMSVSFSLGLQNQTMDAALNVLAKVKVVGRAVSAAHSIDEPLLHGGTREVPIVLRFTGHDLDYFLGELTARRSVPVEVTTSYRSLEGINWETTVIYELSCREGQRDVQLFNSVRDNTWNNEETWPSGASVAIESRIKSGSWNHRIC